MSEIDLLYFGMTGIFLHLFRFDKLSQLEQSYLISPLLKCQIRPGPNIEIVNPEL